MKKRIISSLLLLGCLVSVAGLGANQGAEASNSYGTKATNSGRATNAYGWTGSNGNTCYVLTTLVDMKDEDTEDGWAQTGTITYYEKSQTAHSSHYVNGSWKKNTSATGR